MTHHHPGDARVIDRHLHRRRNESTRRTPPEAKSKPLVSGARKAGPAPPGTKVELPLPHDGWCPDQAERERIFAEVRAVLPVGERRITVAPEVILVEGVPGNWKRVVQSVLHDFPERRSHSTTPRSAGK